MHFSFCPFESDLLNNRWQYFILSMSVSYIQMTICEVHAHKGILIFISMLDDIVIFHIKYQIFHLKAYKLKDRQLHCQFLKKKKHIVLINKLNISNHYSIHALMFETCEL